MHYYQNYTTVNDTGQTISANFIAGEVSTKKDFSYGIFECNANFAYEKGSFPAFWLYNDTSCFDSSRPEIDIVECKANHSNPTLDNNIFYYYKDRCHPDDEAESNEFTEHNFTWGGSHTFKCIWSPSKIEFWVDNSLKKTVNNTGQYWYPNLRQHVILSQQVVRYGVNFPSTNEIVTPQTSSFDWVKVREFFLAPVITGPKTICDSDSVTLDVDERATNFTWSLTPTNLFSGAKTGTGKTAAITAASGVEGEGKIIYSFKMPSGESFTAEKTVWIGAPKPADFYITAVDNSGSSIGPSNGPFQVCPNNYYTFYMYPSYNLPELHHRYGITDTNFFFDFDYQIVSEGYGWAHVYVNDIYGDSHVVVYADTECSGYGELKDASVNEGYCGYYLMFTPNPVVDETSMSIVSNSSEVKVDENIEWELVVYDSFQSLKEKKTKLKGNEYKIQTSSWKEGVYIIRVKYKNEILQGKLAVKK